MPSIKDLARQCHCSPSTVARAFAEGSVIKPETKAHILETAARIGYTPNALARGLKRSKSQTIGLVVPHVENNFYLDLIRYIEMDLQKKHYNLIVSFISNRYSPESERRALESLLRARAEAIIFIPSTNLNADYVNLIRNQQYILQMFTSPYDTVDSLVIDDAYGMQLATEHLIDMGHRSILCINYESHSDGFAKAMALHGLPVDPALICSNIFIDKNDAKELLTRKKPSAVLVHANMASPVIQAIHELQWNIPNDISFVVYDDNPWASMMEITAVGHPFKEISETAVNTIFTKINNPTPYQNSTQTIQPFLVKRHSVIER